MTTSMPVNGRDEWLVVTPRGLTLLFAWSLWPLLLLAYLKSYGSCVSDPFGFLLFWPAVLFGSVVPIAWTTSGYLTGGRASGFRGWVMGVFVVILVLLFHTMGSFPEFLLGLIPMAPSVMLTGVAVFDRRDWQLASPSSGTADSEELE